MMLFLLMALVASVEATYCYCYSQTSSSNMKNWEYSVTSCDACNKDGCTSNAPKNRQIWSTSGSMCSSSPSPFNGKFKVDTKQTCDATKCCCPTGSFEISGYSVGASSVTIKTDLNSTSCGGKDSLSGSFAVSTAGNSFFVVSAPSYLLDGYVFVAANDQIGVFASYDIPQCSFLLDGGSSVVTIVVIVLVVLCVIGGAVGGFLFYKRRRASFTAV